MRIRFSDLIRSDIEYINDRAAWTEDQAAIFAMLVKGEKLDAGIMQACHMGNRRYYRIKHEICDKIERIMREKRA